MKKLLPLLLVIICLGLLATPAMAVEDTVTVYADPFNDWTDIYLFIWNEAGAYVDWPGTPMTDADNDGWYELEIPTGYPNLIVTDNSTAKQTIDIAWEGNVDCWVTLNNEGDSTSKYSATVDYMYPGPAQSDTDTGIDAAPATLEYLALVGEGLEGLNWDVTDPNNLMERNGDLFTKELYLPAGTELLFKFCGNGDWSAGFDYGITADYSPSEEPVELAPEGINIQISALVDTTLRFTVDTAPLATGGNPTLLVEQEVATYTVHVDPYDDWTTVYLYACRDDVIALASRPGDALTDADGDGWFEIQIPVSHTLLQLHDGLNRATELLEVTGQEVWLTMTDMAANTVHCDISYINPGPADTAVTPEFQPLLPEFLSIVGSNLTGIPNWDPNASEGIMDQIAPGIYNKELLISSWTDIAFKFVGNCDWDSGFNFGTATIILGEGVELTNDIGSTDIYLNQIIGCRLRFTVDLTGFDGTNGALLLVEEIPNEMKTVYVHAFEDWGTPYCVAWMDMNSDGGIFYNTPIPGYEMSVNGDWYTLEVPVWCDRLRIFKGDEDESTENLELDQPNDVWVVIEDGYEYWSHKATVYYEEPVIEPEPEDVTVYAFVPGDWTDVYCLAWNDTKSAFDGWPGKPMTKDGDWYAIQIPGWCDIILIHDYSLGRQTFDLSIEPGRDVWLDCTEYESVEIYYEEPILEIPTDPTEEPDEPTDPSDATGETVETESTYPKMTRPHDYEEAEKQSEKAKKDSGSPLVIILIAVGAVVLIGGVTLIFVLKKKKKA